MFHTKLPFVHYICTQFVFSTRILELLFINKVRLSIFALFISFSYSLNSLFSLYSSFFQIWKTNMVVGESVRIVATRWFSMIDIRSNCIFYGLKWILFVISICNCHTFLMWVCQSQSWICKYSSLKISCRTVVKSNIPLRLLKFLWVFCPF